MKKTKRILFIFLFIASLIFIILAFLPKKPSEKTDATPTPTTIIDIKDTEQTKISPIAAVSGFENNQIFGVNRKNGNLIQFKDGKESVVYSGVVKDYSIKDNLAAILDDNKPSEILILDLNNKSQNKINLANLSPIISVALSDDKNTVYFLAEFTISKKISSINSISITGADQKRLGETPSQNIKYLKNNILLLLEEAHADEKGSVHFFDTGNGSVMLTKIANSFHISPDKNNVLLQTSDKIGVVNTDSLKFQSKSTELSNRSLWKDNNTAILFRNDSQGVNYATLTINPFELSPFKLFIKDSAMQTAFGFLKDTLFWQGYNENIYTTILEL